LILLVYFTLHKCRNIFHVMGVHLTFLRRRFEHSALKCMKSIHYPYRFRLFMTPK
jgi:hypothetical protein